MASNLDLMFMSVDRLAALVRSGELSARELVGASLAQIEELDPALNAFVDVFADDALAYAGTIAAGDPRPFAGVPIAIKNNSAIAGRRLTFGAGLMGDFTPKADSTPVRRIREAGFVIVGTTTLPEWGAMGVTRGRRFGPTRNPWDPARTTGGSSGGSAAAVAAGMVPVAHANDGAGSTRIPAACCGLVGLKPQRDRISSAPSGGHELLVCDGVLTHTVAETAQLLDVLAGYEVGDASWAPPPPEPFALTAARAPGAQRIAVTVAPPIEVAVDAQCARAVDDAAALLRSLGHEVVEADPPWRRKGLLRSLMTAFDVRTAALMEFAAHLAGHALGEDDVEPLSWHMYSGVADLNATGLYDAERRLQAFGREFVTWLSGFDALLTPALAQPPVRHEEIDPLAPDARATQRRSAAFTPFLGAINATGLPAISLPLGVRDDGLPIGVQLVGGPAGEGALLALAAQLETAAGRTDRHPPPRAAAA
jgi:amidase